MAAKLVGRSDWRMVRDAEGHRDYRIKFKVACGRGDGPAIALSCPGIPRPQTIWLVDFDLDEWAWCQWDATVTPIDSTEEITTYWIVDLLFSTKSPNIRRCVDVQVDDPLLIPQRVSGDFTKFTEEASFDRFGLPLVSSSWEQYRGPQVEFDAVRGSVRIEQNVPLLQPELWAPMLNTLNDSPLWGLPNRWIKLSTCQWEKKFYATCEYYYTRTFNFELSPDFDRNLLDEGTKALNGHWHPTNGRWITDLINGVDPDPNNPSHFKRFVDRDGNPARVILDGRGKPFNPDTSFTCFNGSHADAESQLKEQGYNYVVGPFNTQGDCLAANGANPYEPVSQDLWWAIITGKNEAGDEDGFCFFGTEEQADFEVFNANNAEGDGPLQFVCYKRGPFTTEFGCSNYLGDPGGTAWWKLQGTGSYPASRRVEKYNESNFLLLGIPTVI